MPAKPAPSISARMTELPGHSYVSTTMIYTHVANAGGLGIASPADGL